ncbi:YidC/Oxa1 family membrane protein insertase [Streptomyces sp. GS7]|uniref:YidC/Oxa1 family membrane protein insertase n=1 Tax=Streptomyces sp. GS7 TaxID=2692234 RepID=UPI00131763B3|nr:membrane protein insertase YidC [Streptomyces sp. GS7]QHC20903.1 membrane protein insertase YidC [Streptomyces sp. GS7]
MSVFDVLGDALARGADTLAPLFGASATAVAIVLFTLGVRAALHPLARAAARGEKSRAALAPQIAALQRRHRGDRERLQQAMTELYAKSGASPLAGCLPTALQVPVFFVTYRIFTSGNATLLGHTLLGAPLGGSWRQALADGGVFGPHGLVYLGLFALIGAVATWNYRRARATAAANPAPAAGPGGTAVPGMGTLAKVMPLLSFGTLITVAVVPLAAGLYLVTSTAWTACERALLNRDRKPVREPESAPAQAQGRTPSGGGARKRAPRTRAARQQAARARANAAARADRAAKPGEDGGRAATPGPAEPAEPADPAPGSSSAADQAVTTPR